MDLSIDDNKDIYVYNWIIHLHESKYIMLEYDLNRSSRCVIRI